MNTSIGEGIRVLRKRAGLSQSELAKRAGVSRNAVSMVENETSNSTINTLISICDALGYGISFQFVPPQNNRIEPICFHRFAIGTTLEIANGSCRPLGGYPYVRLSNRISRLYLG